MHGKSEKATKPENRKKLAELADAHRKIAQIRAKKVNLAQSERSRTIAAEKSRRYSVMWRT
jgi:hypothetical protein